MSANFVHSNPPVRALKKVRRQFLYKAPEEDQTSDALDSFHHILNEKICNSQERTNNAQQNKKIGFAPEHIILYFNITNIIIENWLGSRVVTLNLTKNEKLFSGHWGEHAAATLESYGDLESALWAQRLRQRISMYRTSMAGYYNVVKSPDPLNAVTLIKLKRKAILKCREIEEKYLFQKYVLFLKKDAHDLLSISFSEGFLKEIGHTPEGFLEWSQEHGIPKTFETKNQVFQNIMREYMSYIPSLECPIKEGEELETIATDKEGNQKTVQGKFVGIFEPSPQASFSYMYFAIKKSDTIDEKENIQQSETTSESELQLKKRLEDFNDKAKENAAD